MSSKRKAEQRSFIAIAVIADRIAYDVQYRPLSGIAVHGQHDYLLIYSFKLN